MVMCGLLLAFGLLCQFRIAYLIGWFIIVGCLVLEHWIARRRRPEVNVGEVICVRCDWVMANELTLVGISDMYSKVRHRRACERW